MKILFVRHGESVDDIEDRFGGWADFELTQKGKQQISETTEKIASLDEKFEIILSSPLKRASQAAEIISSQSRVNVEIFEYLKERNLNGIFTGMIRSEAKKKYPNLVRMYQNHEFVDGSERTIDFSNRVKNGIKILLNMKYGSVIAVTHGLFLKTFLKEFMNTEISSVGDGGFVLVEEKDGNFNMLKNNGINFNTF